MITVALLLGGAAGGAYAERLILDDDSSAQYLALHIASDSGIAPENYDRYSRKLAKTLSLLSPEQQLRVIEGSSVGIGAGGLPGVGEGGDGGSGGNGETDLGEGDGGGSGSGENTGEPAFDEQRVEEMREFEEFILGGSSGWDGSSEPWWWELFRQIFQKWLEKRSGGGVGL